MSASNAQKGQPPRMWWWIVATITLLMLARYTAEVQPAGLLAVSLYKCHLMSLGGWGGYWLDRALFPYARPHTYVADQLQPIAADQAAADRFPEYVGGEVAAAEAARDYPLAMLRRAVIVAACLICVGLGA